ncbi:hypothetical protein BKA83DRAFT_1805288 [Pisolithus microcarpus]|nr:hypothetical protein BKA83DRAFT_1805288 [Pisolithus microcarpus]
MSSHTNEMRYWRNFAMRRGHEQLDPERVYNAIRDIYENDLLRGGIHNDRHRQSGPQSPIHTLQDPIHDHSHSHPHAPTSNPAHIPRPVVPPEARVSPVIPSGTSLRPPLQQRTPRRRPLSPRQQQSHGSHTPAHSRATQLDYGYPLPNPRLNEEPIIPGYHMNPQYGHPSPFLHETTQIPPPRRPNSRSPPTPEPYAFRFPTRPLAWTPDPRSPQQHPHTPAAAAGRAGNTESGQESGLGRQRRPAAPPAPVQHLQQEPPPTRAPPPALSVLRRPAPPPQSRPFYGTLPPLFPTPGVGSIPQWSPATWPPPPWPTDAPVRLAPHLIPNPVNPYVPQLEWDVSRHPSTARRVTSAHVTIPLHSTVGGGGGGGGRDGRSTGPRVDEPVTYPASDRIIVSCDQIGIIGQLWGPIVIERSGGRSVTIRDLLAGIYAFFQSRVTRAEVDRISSLGRDNYRSMVDAYRRRTTRRELGALRDWEWREGMRRVDCLGEGRWWWGAWLIYPYYNDGDDNLEGTPWRLHLGLMDSAHRNVIHI